MTRFVSVNRTRMEEAKRYLTDNSKTYVIEGGNHAQFGNYGAQDGDGEHSDTWLVL